MRLPHDNYATPINIVGLMIEKFKKETRIWDTPYWEPCAGDGRITQALKDSGVSVVHETDIATGQDFFDFDRALSTVVVTNPPFKYIRKFIDHAFSIGVCRMALVCPERLWACKKGREQFERHRPSLFANLDWREDYLGKGGAPDRALAVSIWTTSCSGVCKFEVWEKPMAIENQTC